MNQQEFIDKKFIGQFYEKEIKTNDGGSFSVLKAYFTVDNLEFMLAYAKEHGGDFPLDITKKKEKDYSGRTHYGKLNLFPIK